MSTQDAHTRAVLKYAAKNMVQQNLKLNRTTDADILQWIEALKQDGQSVQGTIKEAIREYIKTGH